MPKLNKHTWNNASEEGFKYQVDPNHPEACGGIQGWQVKKGSSGWMKRQFNCSMGFYGYGPSEPISDSEGECLFEDALLLTGF